MALWIEELTPYYGPHLTNALLAGCRETWMPSIGWVLEKRMEIIRSERRLVERNESAAKFEINQTSAMAPDDVKTELEKLRLKFQF